MHSDKDETMGVPNLDAMDADDLRKFWARSHFHPVLAARETFGRADGGRTRVRRDLGNYAMNKNVAIKCREFGDINAALVYEQICDHIYDELPEWARW